MRVGLVVDEVAEASQLWLRSELDESLTGPLWREQVEPGDHAANPRVFGRLLEHRVRVQVGARRLHENGPLDTRPLEKWLEILRVERPPDGRVFIGQPRLRLAFEVPEVVVGVDKHQAR